jgi:hypothetical protein
MAEEVISPARRTLEAQLDSVRMISAIESGRWAVLKFAWPDLFVRVTGCDPDSGCTFCQDFHLECEGYPDPGPFVERWAFTDQPGNGSRPTPPVSGSPGFVDALKDWNPTPNQHGGIYRAWQRYAATHNNWTQKCPTEVWHRNRNIVFIMERLYALVSEQAVWLAKHF